MGCYESLGPGKGGAWVGDGFNTAKLLFAGFETYMFITVGPMKKLWAGGKREKGGHVLRDLLAAACAFESGHHTSVTLVRLE